MQRIIVLSSYLKLSIIQLTMRKTGLLLISLLFCASCADKHDHKGQTPLVAVSYTHLRAHETPEHLVCRLLLEKKNTLT